MDGSSPFEISALLINIICFDNRVLLVLCLLVNNSRSNSYHFSMYTCIYIIHCLYLSLIMIVDIFRIFFIFLCPDYTQKIFCHDWKIFKKIIVKNFFQILAISGFFNTEVVQSQ